MNTVGRVQDGILPVRPVGATSVLLTMLGFGASPIGNLGREVSDEAASAAVDQAWSMGIRYFDTAPHYGLGLSERRLGQALAARERGQFVISTKVGRRLQPNPEPAGSDLAAGGFAVPDDLRRTFDYSRDGVMRSIESSLNRLEMDRIDVVYIHDPDQHMDIAIAEAVPALIELRDQGVIRAVGAGMNTVAPLLRFVETTEVDVLMVAGRYTLADRSGHLLLDRCRERGVAVVAAAPFNSGLLARPNPAEGTYFDYRPASKARLAQARELARICQSHGIELPHAAVHFPLRHPSVSCLVAGMRTDKQVESVTKWLRQPVPAALWDELDELVPGWGLTTHSNTPGATVLAPFDTL